MDNNYYLKLPQISLFNQRKGFGYVGKTKHLKINNFLQPQFVTSVLGKISKNVKLWPLLLTWFNFNPSMDK